MMPTPSERNKAAHKHKARPLQYSICVSGAAAGPTVTADADLAERLGEAIAKAGHVLTTGATVGLPYYAARGAQSQGGMSVGFSPASSLREHLRKYRLPRDVFDFINFTGMNYVGRDLYLVQSSDAVLSVGGRIGSLHEFTSALESWKHEGNGDNHTLLDQPGPHGRRVSRQRMSARHTTTTDRVARAQRATQ